MEREACVCDHGYERSDLCAEIIIIIIIIIEHRISNFEDPNFSIRYSIRYFNTLKLSMRYFNISKLSTIQYWDTIYIHITIT